MELKLFKDDSELGVFASRRAATILHQALQEKGKANLILATGASQFSVLENLVEENIDWSRVTMFHLDEYINLPEDHPASFRGYLRERFLDKINNQCTHHLIDGNQPKPREECQRLSQLIQEHPIDVALIGIGENGHLAFNDPPADFETTEPYIVVNLDKSCRQQQLGEGWFKSLEEVPMQAISMSIHQIMISHHLIVSVPDTRKARAVKNAVEGPLTNECPASILREHENCHLLLDEGSASLLTNRLK